MADKKEEKYIPLPEWIVVGATVYSDFYMQEASMPRIVTKVHDWHNGTASVSTDGGNGGRELTSVDFQTWIRKEPK